MEIRFFNLNKPRNSTATVAGYDAVSAPSSALVFECTIKDATDVLNPVITLQTTSEPPLSYNWCYIPKFHRCYFVNDFTNRFKTWEVSLSVDVMGTYKNSIGNGSVYVSRASSDYDGRIVDNAYPLMTYHDTGYTQGITPWLHDLDSENIDVRNGGCFVLGIVCKPTASGAGSFGSITYYVIEQASLRSLVSALLSDSLLTDHGFSESDMKIALQKSIVDPLQFIKSCMWLPLAYDQISGSADMHSIDVWDWTITDSGFTCKVLTKNPPYGLFNVVNDIHKHPWSVSHGEYMNTFPYTKYKYTVPPFGMFDIDTALCANATQIRGQILLDYITGLGTLDIIANGVCMHRVKAQVGVPIQLSQVSYDYIGSLSSAVGGVVGTIGSLLTGSVEGAISGVSSMIGSAVNAFIPSQSSVGGSGGFSELRGKANLYYEHYYPVDEDNANRGRPLCEIRTVSSLSGYMLCENVKIPINCTNAEYNDIVSIMESGFYYE